MRNHCYEVAVERRPAGSCSTCFSEPSAATFAFFAFGATTESNWRLPVRILGSFFRFSSNLPEQQPPQPLSFAAAPPSPLILPEYIVHYVDERSMQQDDAQCGCRRNSPTEAVDVRAMSYAASSCSLDFSFTPSLSSTTVAPMVDTLSFIARRLFAVSCCLLCVTWPLSICHLLHPQFQKLCVQ